MENSAQPLLPPRLTSVTAPASRLRSIHSRTLPGSARLPRRREAKTGIVGRRSRRGTGTAPHAAAAAAAAREGPPGATRDRTRVTAR